ncbi:MAG: alpha/beta hydrolase [Chloroflexi bacterium]|nr:alpha/beta hydrolase [Chloroflexota bacterium]
MPAERSIRLDNRVTLAYAEQGDPAGVPVVLLHGFADSWRSWELVLPHLLPSLHVLALTQRGHGDSGRPPSGYGIVDMAGDLAAFLDALALRSAILVGHSMGSAVAQRLAIDHPERVAGLVLVGAAPSLRASEASRAYWTTALAALSDPVDAAWMRRMIERSLARPVPPEFVDSAVRESLKVPARVWRAVFEARWRLEGDFEAELSAICAPTLVVWGDRDARYPRHDQDRLVAAMPNARLLVYECCGHNLHWEQPERVAADVAAFVATTHRAPASGLWLG